MGYMNGCPRYGLLLMSRKQEDEVHNCKLPKFKPLFGVKKIEGDMFRCPKCLKIWILAKYETAPSALGWETSTINVWIGHGGAR